MSPARAATLGLIQAAALAVYCWAVSLIFFRPGFVPANPPAGAIFFLLLFVFSAVVSGAMVLGYPGYLTLKGRWREAASLVGATAAWLALFLVALALVIFRPI